MRESRNLRAKVVEWVSRYGVAECVGVTFALIGSFAVRRATGNAVAAAYGGAAATPPAELDHTTTTVELPPESAAIYCDVPVD